MAAERWRAVPGWDHYEVSDQGRVRSLDREFDHPRGPRKLKGKVLAGVRANNGYRAVTLRTPGARLLVTVHTLVLEAFDGPRPPGMYGLHWDDNKENNALENLFWGTPGQNSRDAVRNGTQYWSSRTHCKNGHELTPDNTYCHPSSRGRGRRCIECCRRRGREYARKKRARKAAENAST